MRAKVIERIGRKPKRFLTPYSKQEGRIDNLFWRWYCFVGNNKFINNEEGD